MNKRCIRFLGILLLSIMTSFSLIVNIDLKNVIVDKSNANMISYALMAFLLFKEYDKYYLKGNKNNGLFIFFSMLLSLFTVIGYSYNKINSWDLCFSNFLFIIITIIKIISYSFLFNLIINKADGFIHKNKNDIKISNKLKTVFEEKPFVTCCIIMLIFWLPYIIAFFPAILSPDPSFQIKQFFGFETKYLNYTKQYENGSTITNHHPVLHTVLLGGCVKVGHLLFDSTNVGLFLYSLIQITILVSTLAFTIKYMKVIKTPYYIRYMTLLFYSIVPVFPLYAMSAVKDVIFTSLVILYMITMFHLVKNNKEKLSKMRYFQIAILMLLVMLFRNNGIYLVVMSFPFLFFVNKNKTRLLVVLALPLVIYNCYNSYLLPYLKISQGSIREMLSIPFQQTARYVKENKNNLDKDEKEAIDKVLGIDTLASRYNPEISDPVKNCYNKDTTKEELKNYFKMWFKGFIKRPDIYIEATFNNIYGYLTPNTGNWYVYTNYDKRLSQEKIFNYSFNKLKVTRSILSGYALSFPYIPLLGLIVNIGFIVWIYMYMFFTYIKDKKFKYLIILTPMISLFLTCLASPVNTYFRYAMPYIFALPIMYALFIYIVRKEDVDV